MTEQQAAKNPEKAIEKLMEEIRREQVPQKILDLAKALQAALDESDEKRK